MRFWQRPRLFPVVFDLGSNKVRVMYRGKLLFEDSSILARNKKEKTTLTVGEAGRKLELNTQVEMIKPIERGRLRELDATSSLVRYLLLNIRINGFNLPAKTPVVSFIPLGLSELEQERWHNLWRKIGAKDKWLIPQTEVISSFLSRDYHTNQTSLLDLGYGVSRLVIMADRAVIFSKEIPWGMERIKEAVDHSLKNQDALLDDLSLSSLVETVASLNPQAKRHRTVRVKHVMGQGLNDLTISSGDVYRAVTIAFKELAELITDVYSLLSPRLQTLFAKSELQLVGGGANLDGIVEYLQSKLSVAVKKNQEAMYFNLIGLESLFGVDGDKTGRI